MRGSSRSFAFVLRRNAPRIHHDEACCPAPSTNGSASPEARPPRFRESAQGSCAVPPVPSHLFSAATHRAFTMMKLVARLLPRMAPLPQKLALRDFVNPLKVHARFLPFLICIYNSLLHTRNSPRGRKTRRLRQNEASEPTGINGGVFTRVHFASRKDLTPLSHI